MLYMPNENLNKWEFSRSQVKGQGRRENKNWNMGNSYGYIATVTNNWFYHRFPQSPHRLMPHLTTISEGCKIEGLSLAEKLWLM